MKPNEEKLRALLGEVLPPSADHCGPDQSRVIEMARQHRAHRRRARATIAATVAITALAFATFHFLRPASPSQPAPLATKPDAIATVGAPIVIRSVDDNELLDLLQASPSGIMEWPNGDRTVFVVMEF